MDKANSSSSNDVLSVNTRGRNNASRSSRAISFSDLDTIMGQQGQEQEREREQEQEQEALSRNEPRKGSKRDSKRLSTAEGPSDHRRNSKRLSFSGTPSASRRNSTVDTSGDFLELFELSVEKREQRSQNLSSGDTRRQTIFSEKSNTRKGFSQLFNFEDDFKVVLEKEEEKKALESFSTRPTRIALQKIYEQSKKKDLLMEKLHKVPTREDLKDYIPDIRDFALYILQLVLLVCATVAYSIIDIFLYNYVFVSDRDMDGKPDIENGVALYAVTVNLLGVCFDFLWKYANCLKVYPNALKTWPSIIFWGALGCITQCLAILAIRYPIYSAAKSGDSCPDFYVFLAGSLVYLLITYLVDFLVMPLLFRRVDPIGKDIIRSKVVAGELKPPSVFIGTATLAWVVVWLIMVHVVIFQRPAYLGIGMEIVLWVPTAITSLMSFMDKGKGLMHNVQYLIYYLWFVYLIPQMTGSIITAFVFLQNTSVRFILSLIFIGLAQFFLTIMNNAAAFMGDGTPTAHFILPVQLFEYFFGAMFFVNVSLDSLFWLMLFAQSFWLIFRNSGLGKDLMVWSYYTLVQPRLKDWGIPFLDNLTFESSRSRLYHQARLAVQYTICDFTVLIGIPLQYFFTTYYMDDIYKIQQYAWFFQMTLCEHDNWVLYKRFLIVAGVKLLFHIMAHSLLWFKVRSYNIQSSEYGLPTISFIGIFSEYLKKYWFYFILVVLYCMKASYIAFSVIVSAENSRSLRDAGMASFDNSTTERDIFWLQDLYVFVGYRFVTEDASCGQLNATSPTPSPTL